MEYLDFSESIEISREREEGNLLDATLRKRFPESFIDSEQCIPEPECTLTVNDVKIGALCNLMGISGHAKVGKSTLIAIILASMLGCSRFGMKSLLPPDARVLITDSDQATYYTARMKRRVQRMLGWPTDENQDRLVAMNLRRTAAEERLKAVTDMMQTMRPNVVVIDNIAHYGVDINDSLGSRRLVDELCRMAEVYRCLIIVVLHSNKAQEDTNMKGHLGSMVQESCSDVIQVRHPSGSPTHEAVHLFSRDQNFGKIAFQFGDDGLPVLCETVRQMEERARMQAALDECRGNMSALLNGRLPISYTQLKTDYMSRFSVGETKAKEQIKLAAENNFITKTDAGLYALAV